MIYRWLEYTGQTLAEACGYGWLDAINPDDRAQSLCNFQNTIEPATFSVADQEFFGGENIVVINATGTPFALPNEEDTDALNEDELFGGEDLLVIATNPTEAAIENGETVAATGELRSFVVADLERDYDLTWDLDVQQQLEAEYTERPVLVVDRVYSSAIPESAK